MHDNEAHWVFGYGSLIWRPGFVYKSAHQALMRGARRSLCIYSHHHRGTPDKPGLVFGLRRGGSCRGMAFEVDAGLWPEVRAYLREREQVSGVYLEAHRSVQLAGGDRVKALTFMVNEAHEQYAGPLDVDTQLALVADAHGDAGPNRDYVINTARHLYEVGIVDRDLIELSRRLGQSWS